MLRWESVPAKEAATLCHPLKTRKLSSSIQFKASLDHKMTLTNKLSFDHLFFDYSK